MTNKKRGIGTRTWILIGDLVAACVDRDGNQVLAARTVRHWCESGVIPASKRGGGRWWINMDELRAQWAAGAESVSMFEQALVGGSGNQDEEQDD